MQLLPHVVAALSVTSIYYVWRTYHQVLLLRERRLRERVAYMLWTAAHLLD